jgi:hypothetical protein
VNHHSWPLAICFVFAHWGLAVLLTFVSPMVHAQNAPFSSPQTEHQNFFGSVARWFDEQAAQIGATLNGARKEVENFGHDAGTIAKSTAQGAKNAADAVVSLPNSRVVSGYEKCQIAANGAADCAAAAEIICKARGLKASKSLDMTRSETCPAKVYLSGHSSGPDCKTETFVSRVLCQ